MKLEVRYNESFNFSKNIKIFLKFKESKRTLYKIKNKMEILE